MKNWKITFRLCRPYAGSRITYFVDGNTRVEAQAQARKVAAVENPGVRLILISPVAVTRSDALQGVMSA